MNIGILALQGAVSEHKISVQNAGMNVIEVKNPIDLQNISGLIMPGGESTTLRKLLKHSKLWEAISKSNLPIMGTCAGAILIGKNQDETFGKMDIQIDRNYYGRQKESFEKENLRVFSFVHLQLFQSVQKLIQLLGLMKMLSGVLKVKIWL